MESDHSTIEPRVKRAWGVILAWIGGITAVLGFIGTITGTFTHIADHFHHNTERNTQIVLAQNQVQQGEYQTAIQTYATVLKADPRNQAALDGQLTATEQWIEDFHAQEHDGQSSRSVAAPLLDQIFPILDSALIRTKSPQAADVQAHRGWAHWLNHYIAMRETNANAERDLRTALTTDPNNVYANAMLGNWLLQNNGNFTEAMQHFDTALATGKERAFVRRFQLAGLTYLEVPGARAATYKAANTMRQGNEPLDTGKKHNILGFCCDPSANSHNELIESLSAVPHDDAWQTYLWLDDTPQSDTAMQQWRRLFIEASLSEIAGWRDTALAQLQALHTKLKGQGTSIDDAVIGAIKRLSQS